VGDGDEPVVRGAGAGDGGDRPTGDRTVEETGSAPNGFVALGNPSLTGDLGNFAKLVPNVGVVVWVRRHSSSMRSSLVADHSVSRRARVGTLGALVMKQRSGPVARRRSWRNRWENDPLGRLWAPARHAAGVDLPDGPSGGRGINQRASLRPARHRQIEHSRTRRSTLS